MNGTLLRRRLPTAVFLIVCAAPVLVLEPAFAQSAKAGLSPQFLCWPITQGDTAVELARRLAGNAAAAYSDAFQIRDPARKMFVPKSRYRRLSTNWQACVATGPITAAPHAYAPVVALGTSAPIVPEEPPITARSLAMISASRPVARAGAAPLDVVFATKAGALVLLVAIVFSVAAAGTLRRPIPPLMQRAGEEFVTAFARPLLDASSGVPPIRARLKFVRRKQQLEISIAPGPGRRYPNLVDHKRNMEYDVSRVMRLLGSHFVVGDHLRTAGKWVVVPIRVANLNHTGVK